jgi:hypothetical protein
MRLSCVLPIFRFARRERHRARIYRKAVADTLLFKDKYLFINGTNISILNYAFFWDVMPCGSCKTRRLGGTYRLSPPLSRLKSINELGTVPLTLILSC